MTSASVSRARGLSEAEIGDLARALRAGMRGDVRVERPYRLLYATDASIYQMEPVAVVFPETESDVQHAVRVAGERGVPLLPRGGGTSLAGQCVNHAIVLDFTPKMSSVLEINREEAWARVQPGLVLSELNRAALPHKLQYAIDPSTANRATIGGGIGNNSCGAHSVIYGKTIDQVLGLRTVLSDASVIATAPMAGEALAAKFAADTLEGNAYREVRRIAAANAAEIERRFPKILRRVSGLNLEDFVEGESMDLARMLVGSEGTLGITTEAKVRLVPVPPVKGIAAVHFRGLVESTEATLAALEHGPSAVELIDDTIVQRCRASIGLHHLADFVQGDPGALLIIEFYGESEAEAIAKLDKLKADFEKKGLGYAVVATTDPARQRDMWRMREAGLGLLMSVRGDTKPIAYVEDTAVAPEKLPRFIERFQAMCERRGTPAAYYGHASVGCLHIRPALDLKVAGGVQQMEEIATEVADLVLEFGGSLSGEHGDGILRGVFTERMFGPTLTQAFRDVKTAFDPKGILNPGKIVDTPGFTDNLRLSPATRNVEPVTYFDYTFEGGIARAAEQCNGQGACRKLDGGMCPSYMVTKDEEHSTRGRANLLRLTFAGVLPRTELTGKAIYDALDLCVECKACKAECPSGVDMAKLKYEALTAYNEANGLPLRSRLFGHIALLSRLGSMVAPLANWLPTLPFARALLQRIAGIHAERPLPQLAGTTFTAWFERHRGAKPAAATRRGEAVLFHDTFTDYYHPEVGQAAVRVLEALGYKVQLAKRQGCCGRPVISKGMLGTAKQWARHNVDSLLPYAKAGMLIVGTEPSCLLTLRDEYVDLLQDDESRLVARQAIMLDELVAKLAVEDEAVRDLFRDDIKSSIHLHGHCHHKALVGMEPTLAMLRLVPGYDVRLIDSACCGMAGSFGFEAEHYDISRSMGALRLFPAVEAAPAEAQIAITGVSCRQQIGHFTSRKPRHAIELLAEALK